MVKSLLNAVNKMLSHDDFGKLLLRLAVGGLMLFHGCISCLMAWGHQRHAGGERIAGVYRLRCAGGEVVAPCLLILGSLRARRRWCWRLRWSWRG
jgi:putative oxidoreductase